MKSIIRKLLAVMMAAMMLCLMMPVSTVSAADNMLINGDFETGDLSGWDNLWGSCTVEMVAGRNGGSALKVSCGQWNMVRQKISVQPNTDYDLTAWAKDATNMTFLVKDGNDTTNMMIGVESMEKEDVSETIKFASIMVATVPILCVYPFIQRYFTKGVMIGAVKG